MNYSTTEAARNILPAATIEYMVRRVAEKELPNEEGVFIQRFQVVTVNGIPADEKEVADAVKNNPDSVSTILPIVIMVEDQLTVMLLSEIEITPDTPEELKKLLDTPVTSKAF